VCINIWQIAINKPMAQVTKEMHLCCLQMHEIAAHISINVTILTVSMATKLADFIASKRLGHI